jgi:acyl carrier protein
VTEAANTIEEFRTVLEDVLEQPGLQIGPSTRAEDVPSWDSLSHVRLLVRLEQLHGISFPVDEVEGVKNVGELLELIDRLKASR